MKNYEMNHRPYSEMAIDVVSYMNSYKDKIFIAYKEVFDSRIMNYVVTFRKCRINVL